MKMESVSSSIKTLKNALKCMKILHQFLLQLIAELTRGGGGINLSQVSLHLYINKHFLSTILQRHRNTSILKEHLQLYLY